MVLATSIPYYVNLASTPRGYRYTWILPPYPEDSFGYMAWSQQAAHGALLFKIKYTALPQSAFLFQPFFLVCGWASRLFAVDVGVVHFVAKEIGVVLFFLVFYKYTDYLKLSAFQSIAASVVVGISAGVGGPLALLGWGHGPVVSVDTIMPDISTYWSLLWNPLFPYSLVLMVLTIYYIDRGTQGKSKADLWLAGLTSGILALIHPYSQPLLLALAVLMIAVRTRSQWLGYLLRYLAILSPFVLYIFLLSTFQPLVVQHSSHGMMRSFAISATLLGFGIPLLMWLAGLTVGWGRWMKRYWQVVVWFTLSLVFAYLPFWFQRKLIFGAHAPLSILAAVSFDLILTRFLSTKAAKWALIPASLVLIPTLAITPIYLLRLQYREVKDNRLGSYYISNDMVDGLKFLKQHSKPNQIVFATLETSRFIPGYAGNTVLWGHWAMTVDYEVRRAWSNELLTHQDWTDENRGKRFWGSGIAYIFADGDLKKDIQRDPWKWQGILKDADEVFHNDTVMIYKHRAAS